MGRQWRPSWNMAAILIFVLAKRLLQKVLPNRALCRIKLLLVTYVFVDTWMLTVKPVYKLLKFYVSGGLKWTTNSCDTISTHFQVITNNIYGFGRPFILAPFFLPIHDPSTIFLPVHIHFTRPNDGWTGLYIKLCSQMSIVQILVRISRSEQFG